ncbi:hypothetical protein CLCR_09860 [Cladophialophora carrionii]|uniref:Uncharacterized protein n=1 Tax=Cladophialophora carrionii TaxID=86049 RepID=A0A1C1CVE7_9EURO|nr:hypothetical protein CLCR_09860 [Cladophialophora carrionii]
MSPSILDWVTISQLLCFTLQQVILRPTTRALSRIVIKLGGGQILRHRILTTITTGVFIGTVLFGDDSTLAPSRYLVRRFGSTVAVLRILQGLTSVLTTWVLSETLDLVQWTLVGREKGLRLLSLLSISPATGLSGMFMMIFLAKLPERAWAMARLLLTAMIWVAEIVLYYNIRVSTVYDAFSTWPVTAGAAPFDTSLAHERVAAYNGNITYQNLAFSNTFVTNSQFSIGSTPISCPGHCDSYILPGAVWSLNMTLPANSSDNTVVKIETSPAVQIDFFRGVDSADCLLPHGCTVYDENGSKIGIELCLAKSKVHEGSIFAGVTVCDQVLDGSCLYSARDPRHINTTFSLYSLTASTACTRANNSIISVTDIGEPTLEGIDIEGLDLPLGWLLNYTAQGIHAESSLVYMFWHGDPHPAARHDWSTATYLSLKSILAFSMYMFSVNGAGDPLRSERSFPSRFETTASLCRPLEKVIVDPGAYIAYIVLQSTVILFLWVVVVWRWSLKTPLQESSAFSLADFAAKFVRKEIVTESGQPWAFKRDFLKGAGSRKVIEVLSEARVVRQRLKMGSVRC